MAAGSFYLPYNPVFTSNGLPIAGAKVAFYYPGTSTKRPVYADAGLTIELPNPVVANGAARLPAIYLDDGDYRVVIFDADGVQLYAIDPYPPVAIGDGGTTTANFNEVDINTYEGLTDDDRLMLAYADLVMQGKTGIFYPPDKGLGPGGDYVIGTNGQNVDPTITGNLKSGISHRGAAGTVIRKKLGVPYIFFANPAGIGTPEAPNTQADAFVGITISDMELKDDVVALGFAEQEALIHVNAVTNFTVARVKFTGPRGDPLYIGAGDMGGGGQNRRNKSVTVRDCTFDGINKNNRNAISVIDVDGMLVANCTVVNMTKPGSDGSPGTATLDPMNPATGFPMPGGIDFEPNTIFTDDPVCRNVVIDGWKVRDNGGAAICTYLGTDNAIPTPMTDFSFKNVFAQDCKNGILGAFSDGRALIGHNVSLDGFACTGGLRALTLTWFRGLAIRNGTFRKTNTPGWVGDPSSNGTLVDFTMEGVTFEQCGTVGGGALQIRGGSNHLYRNINFNNCSVIGMSFVGTHKFEKSRIEGLTFTNDTGAPYSMATAIQGYTFEGTPVIDGATVSVSGLTLNGLPITNFAANGVPVRSAPTTGRFVRGNRLPINPAMEPGSPRAFYTINDNVLPAAPSFARDGVVPGAAADKTSTVSISFTRTGDVVADSNFRFTAGRVGGLVYSTNLQSTASGQPGWGIEFAAPYSGETNIFAGYTATTPTGIAADQRGGVLFDGSVGALQAIVSGGPSGLTFSSFDYGRLFRIIAQYEAGAGQAVMRVYRFNGAAFVQVGGPYNLGTGTGMRVYLVLGSEASIQITATGSAATLTP